MIKTRWDPFDEKMVEVDLGELKEEHAELNKLEEVRLIGKTNYASENRTYYFWITTSWDREGKEKFIGIRESLYQQKALPMIAIVIDKHIREGCADISNDMNLTQKDSRELYKKISELIVDYDANTIIPETKPEPIVDLRPYVFLRFLLSLPIIPEEVLHAMYVQQEAMQAQKRILEESERIKQLKTEHYAKYGNLAQKSKAYLTNFFK